MKNRIEYSRYWQNSRINGEKFMSIHNKQYAIIVRGYFSFHAKTFFNLTNLWLGWLLKFILKELKKSVIVSWKKFTLWLFIIMLLIKNSKKCLDNNMYIRELKKIIKECLKHFKLLHKSWIKIMFRIKQD